VQSQTQSAGSSVVVLLAVNSPVGYVLITKVVYLLLLAS